MGDGAGESRPFHMVRVNDDLDGFDCGVPALGEWLKRFALSGQGAGASVTYVLEREQQVVGFYSLAPHAMESEEAPRRLGAGLARQRPIPVILLARLALDRSVQGIGLGGDLLKDALARCAAAADDIGGRAVLVHAKDAGAAAFYQRYGFVSLGQNPNHLYVLMKDLRASIRRSIE
ncbi:MAG TPA: GNAT family N-acetyltransferase [Acidimicrobiia bacterium]|nr:GNAT family N-acetyltransferase [Acidimicrobiia bacterium]